MHIRNIFCPGNSTFSLELEKKLYYLRTQRKNLVSRSFKGGNNGSKHSGLRGSTIVIFKFISLIFIYNH